MVHLLSSSRVVLAILSCPLLFSGVSAMFNATNDDFMSVYHSNSIKPPSEASGYRLSARSPNYWEARSNRELSKRAQDAPHWAVYHNRWSQGGPPSPSEIEGFNVYYLTFLLSMGPWDMAQEWVSIGADERARIKREYNDAGIKLMIAVFGATEEPTTGGADPVATAQQMAAWVKEYGLDGVDVDYEDFPAMSAGTAEDWLIAFTNTLRSQLPASDGYLITHAPVAPWFTPTLYPGGGYLKVHKEAGDAIDWYNLQFYNQGTTEYTDCAGLLDQSSNTWPETAVFQIVDNGIPANKLVIGKPAGLGDANNGQMAPSDLAVCLSQAKERGWNGGAMAWQYPTANSAWIRTVRSQSFPV